MFKYLKEIVSAIIESLRKTEEERLHRAVFRIAKKLYKKSFRSEMRKLRKASKTEAEFREKLIEKLQELPTQARNSNT